MSIVGIMLDYILSGIAGATPLDVVPNTSRFIPTWPEIEQKYLSDTAAFEQMLTDYRDLVALNANSPVLTALGGPWDVAMAEAQGFFRTNNKALSLPHADVRDLSFRLVLQGTSGNADTREAWKLVNGGAAEVSAAMATRPKAVEALKQLRRLDDIAIRWQGAGIAADDCGIPFEETLALYRMEGNLQVPASTESIMLGVPTASLTTPTFVKPSSLRSSVSVRLTTALAPTLAPTAEWMLQMAGLDHVTVKLSRDPATLAEVTRNEFLNNFAQWSSENWAAHRPGSTDASTIAALARWNALESNITPTFAFIDGAGKRQLRNPVVAGVTGALVATVDRPIEFVAGVLAEAAMFLRKLARPDELLGVLPATHGLSGEVLPDLQILGALSYNAQMGDVMKLPPYNRPNNAQRQAVLVGIARAAERSTHANAKPLSALIKGDAAFRAIVKSFKGGVNADRIEAEEWPDMLDWLAAPGHPERLKAVATFIEKAETGEWGAWNAYRAYGSRYRRLWKFYERVINGAP